MTRFQNPWAKGGDYYPNEVLERNILDTQVVKQKDSFKERREDKERKRLAEDVLYRDNRIKNEIAALRRQYPNKSIGELQTMIAIKYQKQDWYRVGDTTGAGITESYNWTNGWTYKTILLVELYQELSRDNILTKQGYTRDTIPINQNFIIDLNAEGKYKPNSLHGKLNVYFDDKGVPDSLIIQYDAKNGTTKTLFHDYGDIGNNDDNIFQSTIDIDDMRNTFLTIKVCHPEDSNLVNTDYELKITAQLGTYAELVEGEFKYPFIDLRYKEK